MSLLARRELLLRIRDRYQQSGKKEKTSILNGFVQATGYGRKYAIKVLTDEFVAPSRAATRQRTKRYDSELKQALLTIWHATNQLCSKRLVPFLPEFVDTLERFGHISLPAPVKEKLLTVSPATVDRLLREDRLKTAKGRSTTKSGNLLKSRIQVRTFADWNDATPGFFEADLVAHCGDSVEGSFLNSLVLTDIATGWTEFIPILRKGEADVINGVNQLRALMPLPLLGLDTDNGSEFINYDLLNFCEAEKITFTRSRAYKKNDQAHVEQKNGSVIRRMVGFDRFEGLESAKALWSLYQVLRLYVNFFQPSVKLTGKTRSGSRVSKQYDVARTPYQRILSSEHVPGHTKQKLQQIYETLDPVQLFGEIGKTQRELWKHAWLPENQIIGSKPLAVPLPILVRPAKEKPLDAPSENHFKIEMPKRQYKKSNKPRAAHTWRTKADPFEKLNEDIELMLRLDPKQTSRELFQRLQERHPGAFSAAQYRTLQRRLKDWRKQLASREFTISIYSNADLELQLDQIRRLSLEVLDRREGTILNDAESMS